MKPEQQQIKIAEACGWGNFELFKGRLFGTNEKALKTPHGLAPYVRPVPDYCNDLNAVQQAVLALGITQRCVFQQRLGELAAANSICFCECSALMWCEAYILANAEVTDEPLKESKL